MILFCHAVCAPSCPFPAPPNSSEFVFAPHNLDYVDLFLHKGWWHLWVLLHKEEVLMTAVAMGVLHC